VRGEYKEELVDKSRVRVDESDWRLGNTKPSWCKFAVTRAKLDTNDRLCVRLAVETGESQQELVLAEWKEINAQKTGVMVIKRATQKKEKDSPRYTLGGGVARGSWKKIQAIRAKRSVRGGGVNLMDPAGPKNEVSGV
jgi:hypothetical protein